MATQINPTRMELTRLKKRLVTATRGHKLLKDKRDEMVRQFMLHIRRNHALRLEVEKALQGVSTRFAMAKAQMGALRISEALLYPARAAVYEVGMKNVMSVDVPTIKFTGGDEATEIPYAFTFTSSSLDNAVVELSSLLPKLLELAEVEKTCNLLADEIEKTRRIRHDPRDADQHQVHHHETGRERTGQHRTPYEGQGHDGRPGSQSPG